VSTRVTTAVVPLRGREGKTRLADRLDARERGAIVRSLAAHVVGTLLAAGPVRDVVVVTREPEFAGLVLPEDPRVTVVAQPDDSPGLNAAVHLGHARAVSGEVGRVLVVHTDLPLLTPEDVRALLAPDAALVVAPDVAGQGTNALVLDAGVRGLAFRFGPGSRAAHVAEAAALGLTTAVVQRPGTATDLDTPADWAALPATVRERLSPASRRGGPPRPAASGVASAPTLPVAARVRGARP